MISIDGLTWSLPCEIQRVAEVVPSELSGLMLDRSYFNDVVGTYLRYTVSLAVPPGQGDQYARIYEALTNPVDGHAFVLPYGTGTVELTARVERVSDVYVRLPGGETHWKGIRFTLVSNYPTKAMSLEEMLVTGRAPYPSVAEPAAGTLYEYTSGGWVPGERYEDGDEYGY